MENHFGSKVRLLLKTKGLKQSDLAKLLETSPQNVTALLNQPNPNFATVTKVAMALNIDPTSFNTIEDSKPAFDLMRTEGTTDFLDMRNDRFLIVTPVISQNYAKVYIKRLQDPEAIGALRKHAVTTKSPKFGEYLSVEVDFKISLGSEIGNLMPGTIVTGRKFANWTNPRLGDLDGVDCILVLSSEIVVTTIIAYDAANNKVTYADKELNSQKELTINSDEILEFYEIEIVTNYGSNNY